MSRWRASPRGPEERPTTSLGRPIAIDATTAHLTHGLLSFGRMQQRSAGPAETAPGPDVSGPRPTPAVLGVRWIFPVSDGRFSPFLDPLTSLGRDPGCAVPLNDDQVSREHAFIHRRGASLVLEDNGSRNGTHLNGEPVQQAPLLAGDILRLGSWIGVVAVDDRAAPAFQRLSSEALVGPDLASALGPALNAAGSGLPIIIEGETGTGKEVAARLIHAHSRRTGALVAVNCAAIPESLAEAELFGFVRGAFTGADQSRPGHLRTASGGTLLLDEVTDLPLPIQAKLLRALERSEVVPLGESRPVAIDLRIVVAAQESLRTAVAEKRFRGDLFARLNGMTVRLPPLRERRQELAFLFREFLAQTGAGPTPALSPRLVERLCLHPWPFNVRELYLLARRMRAQFPDERALSRSHLPAEYRGEQDPRPPAPLGDHESQLAALKAALRDCGGNVARAAARMGISRPRAYRLMKGAGLSAEQLRDSSR
jgi:transcriptional regulator with AAA-type ATPase domain